MKDTQHQSSEQKPQFGHTKSGVIILRHVRVRYFALYNPAPDLSGKDKYSITCEISPEQLKFLEEEMKQTAIGKWNDRAEVLWPKLNKGAKNHIPEKGESYLRISASNNTVDRHGNPIAPPKLYTRSKQESKLGGIDEIYAGCYVNLYVTPSAYDQGSSGVKFYIRAVQFVEDGTRIAGSAVETDELDDLSDVEEADPADSSW